MVSEEQYGPVFLDATVLKEWLDYNGHMNMAHYVLLFDQALSNFYDHVGLGQDYVVTNGMSLFDLESHITYQNELFCGEAVNVHFQLLDIDSKFIHYFMRLVRKDGALLSASMEQISLHMSMKNRRPTRFPEDRYQRLGQVFEEHQAYPTPREMGRSIGIRGPKTTRKNF